MQTILSRFGLVLFLLLSALVVGCNKKEYGKPTQVDATLVKASYTPSKSEIVYGYHFSAMKGKMVFGPHLKTTPAVYATTFTYDGAEYSTDNSKACLALQSLLTGSKIHVTLRDVHEIIEKGTNTTRKFVGYEILDVVAVPPEPPAERMR
jgi:hypothetical protein